MPSFISDKEMEALAAKAKPRSFISDEEMNQIEAKTKPVDRTAMLAQMQAEDEAAKPSFAKEYGKQLAGATYGAVEALSPVNIPKGIEILGRAVVTERGGPLERLSKASQKSVIPGQEEIGAGIRALVPDEGEEGLPFKERYKREMQAQEQLLPEVIAPEGRLMGNLGVAIAGIAQGVRSIAQARKAKGLASIPDEALPKGDVIPEEVVPKKSAQDLASKLAQESQLDEIAKSADDFDNVPQGQKIQKPDPTPEVTLKDKSIANVRKVSAPEATAEDVAYFKKYQDRIRKGPSLDENAPNPMSNQVLEDFDNFQKYLDDKEAKAAKMIEDSGFSMRTGDVAKIFKKQIKKLSGSGARFTKSNKAAIGELQQYVDSLLENGEDVVLSSRQVRQLMQGLWRDNKMSFVPGREPTVAENAISQVTGTMNQILKKGVGKEYAAHMKDYAPEVAAVKKMIKEWKIDSQGVPQMNGWFKNRMVYHFQEAEFGNRPATDPMLRAISLMGDRLGKNYASMIKDQLVYGRMFPEEAKGLQGGTATSWWTRAAKRGLSPKGWAEEAIRSGTEKLAERPLRKSGTKEGLAGKVKPKPKGEK